jgi:hypothetical protein
MEPKVPPIVDPTIPPVQSPQNKFKFISIFLGILLVVVLCIGGYYFLSQKQLSQSVENTVPTAQPVVKDETAGWKVYENSVYGYFLKYPTEKYVRLVCPGDEQDNFYLILKEDIVADTDVVNMSSCDRDSHYTMEINQSEQPLIPPTSNEWVDVSSENITINGFSGNRYTSVKTVVPSPYPDWSTQVLFTRNGINYSIFVSNKNSEEIFNQILSTFKFNEASRSVDIPGWKTYTNKSGRYSLKYPETYSLIKEDGKSATFGFGIGNEPPYPYLTVSSDVITDVNSYKLCSELQSDSGFTPCIGGGDDWGQSGNIVDNALGGRKAKSFYLGGGPDYAYHIVQTTEEPRIELKMNVAGGGLNDTFGKILSTFTFLN